MALAISARTRARNAGTSRRSDIASKCLNMPARPDAPVSVKAKLKLKA
jgi:hypothetical protein